jgi:hypothetical protein
MATRRAPTRDGIATVESAVERAIAQLDFGVIEGEG